MKIFSDSLVLATSSPDEDRSEWPCATINRKPDSRWREPCSTLSAHRDPPGRQRISEWLLL
jgi:hypothetical protein